MLELSLLPLFLFDAADDDDDHGDRSDGTEAGNKPPEPNQVCSAGVVIVVVVGVPAGVIHAIVVSALGIIIAILTGA